MLLGAKKGVDHGFGDEKSKEVPRPEGNYRMTPFGKAVRHLRIEHEMLLGEMAEMLSVSSSYISQVETGKKQIPDGFVEKVAKLFRVTGADLVQLHAEAAKSMSEFRIKVGSGASSRDRVLANEIAMEFARLSPDAKEKIQSIMRGKG